MEKKGKRDAATAAKVQKVAEIAGVSKAYVYMVINGTRDNEEVFRTYMLLAEGENELLNSVRELVQF